MTNESNWQHMTVAAMTDPNFKKWRDEYLQQVMNEYDLSQPEAEKAVSAARPFFEYEIREDGTIGKWAYQTPFYSYRVREEALKIAG